jgi:hypothetical protein
LQMSNDRIDFRWGVERFDDRLPRGPIKALDPNNRPLVVHLDEWLGRCLTPFKIGQCHVVYRVQATVLRRSPLV